MPKVVWNDSKTLVQQAQSTDFYGARMSSNYYVRWTGLIHIEKGYDRNRPQTVVRITSQGRTRYLDYLTVLEQVVFDAANAAKASAAPLNLRRLKPV